MLQAITTALKANACFSVYLGDTADDAVQAATAGVAYIHAIWGNNDLPANRNLPAVPGIAIAAAPQDVIDYLPRQESEKSQ